MISKLLVVATVLAGSALGVAAPALADSGLPSGTTPVPVTAGQTSSGIDMSVDPAGSISGKVLTTAGKPVTDAQIHVYDSAKKPRPPFTVFDDQTTYLQVESDGRFTAAGLVPGTYYLCVYSDTAVDGCYGGVAKPAGADTVPAGAEPITVGAGQKVTGADITLTPGTTLAGRVRSGDGRSQFDATVIVTNLSTGESSRTDTSGSWSVGGLAASTKGYTVCVAATDGDGPRLGLQDRCYGNVAWVSPLARPASATRVQVAAGATRTGLDVTLPVGGAITGSVRATGAATGGLTVSAFLGSGPAISHTQVGSGDVFTVGGLPTSDAVKLCVTATSRTRGQCWKGAAYTSGAAPTSAAPIHVKAGQERTGFAIKLATLPAPPAQGHISGVITLPDGSAVADAEVHAYNATTHAEAAYETTGDDGSDNPVGSYTLDLAPGTYVVCAQLDTADQQGPTGNAPQCLGAGWNGRDVPAGATKVTVTSGRTSKVSFALPTAGAIAGTVTMTTTTGVSIAVFDSSGTYVTTGYTDSDGSQDNTEHTDPFRIIGVPASSTGYTVCVSPTDANYGPDDYAVPSDVGTLGTCYKDRPYNG